MLLDIHLLPSYFRSDWLVTTETTYSRLSIAYFVLIILWKVKLIWVLIYGLIHMIKTNLSIPVKHKHPVVKLISGQRQADIQV